MIATAASLLLLFFASPESEIKAVLDLQVAAWNRGDLVAFMEGYENASTTTFLSSAGLQRGYQTVHERYKKTYSDKARMGKLAFSELEFRMLSSDSALVIGKFHLSRTAEGGGDASGRFTLVFKKTAQGWRVIHDHTS